MSSTECVTATPGHMDFMKSDDVPLPSGSSNKQRRKSKDAAYSFCDFLAEKRLLVEFKPYYNIIEDPTKHVCFMETKEFPSFHYVLEESENALKEMQPMVEDLKRVLSEELANITDERLRILLRELNKDKFRGNKIILSIIGEDLNSIRDSLSVNWQGQEYLTSTVVSKSHLYTINICIPDNLQEDKMLRYLRDLSSEDRAKTIFVTTDKERIQTILEQRFPDTFPEVLRCPIFAEKQTLKTAISDVLTERLFGILDLLLNVLQYLNKITKGNKEHIENAIEDIESLLQERPGTNAPKLNCIDEDFRNSLSRLKEKGVNGYCIYGEKLIVFVDSESKDIANIRDEINTIASKQVQDVIILPGKCPLNKSQITDGDKIIPQREMKRDKRFGTIGTFVEDDKKCKIGLTAGHVVYKDETVFTDDEALLGTCKDVSDQEQNNASNLAVIEVHHQAIPKCKERPTKLVLFGRGKMEIANGQRVYKIGAKTGKTVGKIVTVYGSNDHPGDFLVVKGLHGKPFSEGGDSGSVVYMRDLSNDKDVAISMITAGGDKKVKSRQTEPNNDFRDLHQEIEIWTYTFMLKKEIDELEKRGCTLQFS